MSLTYEKKCVSIVGWTRLSPHTVMSAAPRSRVGVLSGILNTTRCLGTALGVALPGLLWPP
jgi:hypothetical protein